MNKNDNCVVFPKVFPLSCTDALSVANSGIYYLETTGEPIKKDPSLYKTYVGQTNNLARRLHEHLPRKNGESAKTCEFDDTIATVGAENVMVKIVCLCDPIDLDFIEYGAEKAYRTTGNVAPAGRGRFTGMERTGITFKPKNRKTVVKKEESLLETFDKNKTDMTTARSQIVVISHNTNRILYISHSLKALREWFNVYLHTTVPEILDYEIPTIDVLKRSLESEWHRYYNVRKHEAFILKNIEDVDEEKVVEYYKKLEDKKNK